MSTDSVASLRGGGQHPRNEWPTSTGIGGQLHRNTQVAEEGKLPVSRRSEVTSLFRVRYFRQVTLLFLKMWNEELPLSIHRHPFLQLFKPVCDDDDFVG
jgi:hypothetical protein